MAIRSLDLTRRGSLEGARVAENGKQATTPAPLLSDRVKRLKDSVIRESVKLSCERLKFILEAWKETEGDAAEIRSARVFEKVLRGMTIYIDENPIVGSLTKHRKGCQSFPEWSYAWMAMGGGKRFAKAGEIRTEENRSSGGMLEVDPDDTPLIDEAIRYFANRGVQYRATQALRRSHPDVDFDAMRMSLLLAEHPMWVPLGGVALDHGKVLNIGLEGVIQEARAEIAKLVPGLLGDLRRRNFLEAVIIACEAVIAWAKRYAALAADMAGKETNGERKRELEGIAETCQRVPGKPARNFREAIQSFWFIHAAAWIEHAQIGHSPGRFCDYMYPFYEASTKRGEITREEAIELLQLLFIKMTEVQLHVFASGYYGSQQHLGQNLNVGGLTRDGRDATNELHSVVLEAQKRVRLIQPTITLMWHNQLSPQFLHECVELLKTGIGQPAFFNCDVAIRRLMDRYHMAIEDARDFVLIACADTAPNHATDNVWEGFLNMGKLIEVTLHNGREPITGKQLGPRTGDPQDFTCYEQLHEALKTQLQYFMPLLREIGLTGLSSALETVPQIFCSALVDDCIKRGKQMIDGGARFSMGDGAGPVGMIDLGNSMAAIKKVVFDKKKTTMAQLLAALEANFEGDGHGEIRRSLLQAPKYGNDDEYVDDIVKEWFQLFWDEHQKFKTHLGTDVGRPYALSVTTHFLLGGATGALPSGRRAFLPLADGSVSACPGTDTKGPTALLRSVVKVMDPAKWALHLFNMKLHPSALASRDGERKFLDLIKTYMDMGGYHVQFNVVTTEALREAQRHPEEHRDLVVRVAGYSAFFVDLSPEMQEEVIGRTEYAWP